MTNRLRVAFAITLLAFAFPPAVLAEDGAWKVGSSYVIRFEKLDLSNPVDRQILLSQVERSAAKLCVGERTRGRQQSCASKAIDQALAANPDIRATIYIARLERDGVQQAQR